MEGLELYRKYRPKNLDEIVGQDSAVKQLRGFLENRNLPHAILFTGGSGVGKTSSARILRTELECGDLDFKEYNSADFSGVDTMRDMRRIAMLKPISGPVRAFLLDECHKGSNSYQHAILKMLEEAPPHVYFFLATTNPEKLLTTVRNRCTLIALESIKHDALKTYLERIIKGEELKVSKETLNRIIKAADGSARAAAVFLQQVAHLSPEEQQEAILSDPEHSSKELCQILLNNGAWADLVKVLKDVEKREDAERMRYAVLGYCKTVLASGGKLAPRAAGIISRFQFGLEQGGWPVFYLYCFEVLSKK